MYQFLFLVIALISTACSSCSTTGGKDKGAHLPVQKIVVPMGSETPKVRKEKGSRKQTAAHLPVRKLTLPKDADRPKKYSAK